MVATFIKGMTASPFSDSLIQNRPKTFSEVRERATTHIEAEEAIVRKNDSLHSRKPRYKESSCDFPSRDDKTSMA